MARKSAKKAEITFRIYPEPSSRLYFLVHVWDTKREMQKISGCGRKTGAFCSSYKLLHIPPKAKDPQQRPQVRPQMGDIGFYKGGLGTQRLSHECAHAAAAYVARKRLSIDFMKPVGGVHAVNHSKIYLTGHWASTAEERFCHVFSNLMHGLVEQLYRLKLLT